MCVYGKACVCVCVSERESMIALGAPELQTCMRTVLSDVYAAQCAYAAHMHMRQMCTSNKQYTHTLTHALSAHEQQGTVHDTGSARRSSSISSCRCHFTGPLQIHACMSEYVISMLHPPSAGPMSHACVRASVRLYVRCANVTCKVNLRERVSGGVGLIPSHL